MAALGALVILLAACLASAYPSVQVADFPENVRGGPSRIVSGWEAEQGQIPHQVSLRTVDSNGFVFACGATVIHHQWALTAAHCTANRVTIVMRFGGVELSRPSLILETTYYYNHPLYIESLAGVVQSHDIGLLEFNDFVEYSDLIKPIRLQSSIDSNNDYNGVVLEASGWGRLWTSGASPEILNWVYLTGVSNSVCRELFGDVVIDSTICASSYNVSSQSTCQGDSGGPLVVRDQDGQLTQVGISSFVSRSGCHTDLPAGFIRPGHYHDWYTEVTGINFDWEFSEVTSVAPEGEASSVAPEGEASSVAPEGEASSVAPEGGSSSVTPEGEASSVATEGGSSSVTPEGEASSVAPEGGSSSVTPEGEASSVAPEGGSSSVAPEGEASSVAPEEEEEVEEEDGEEEEEEVEEEDGEEEEEEEDESEEDEDESEEDEDESEEDEDDDDDEDSESEN